MNINNNSQNMEGIKAILNLLPFHPSYALPQPLEIIRKPLSKFLFSGGLEMQRTWLKWLTPKVINGYRQIREDICSTITQGYF